MENPVVIFTIRYAPAQGNDTLASYTRLEACMVGRTSSPAGSQALHKDSDPHLALQALLNELCTKRRLRIVQLLETDWRYRKEDRPYDGYRIITELL